MILRIVRLSFLPEAVPEFLELFKESKQSISSFAGCESLDLFRDSQEENVFYTQSIWVDENALNAYRNSDFFKETWKKTKLLFNDQPRAYSLLPTQLD